MDYLFSIMGLNEKHIDEICEDIKQQYESGVMSCALFSMTLVPEGNPPTDKVGLMCAVYDKYKERLDKVGVPSGVLVQASIGHGWVLGEMFPYQQYIGWNGHEANTVCPYDEGFKQYIFNVMRTITMHNPHHIMVDDDYRLIGRAGGGCLCPLHVKRFNELAGTDFDAQEIAVRIMSEKEEDKKYSDIFLQTQKEAVVETAKVMRAGVDSVNPDMHVSFCTVGNNAEFAGEISTILAGEGKPVIVRLNNGNYTPAGARFFSNVFFRAAAQIAKLRDTADVFLAETDTCPQNRYSTSAMSLHTHFTGSILEGCAGAKHWITRLATYEPQSGVAYRKVLAKNKGFYDALAKLVPTLRWRGCRIPVLKEPKYDLGNPEFIYGEKPNGWGSCVLERFGVPMYFSPDNGKVTFLEGEVNMSDDEIMKMLESCVFLASDSAKCLVERGFGEYIGVDVREWKGKSLSGERLCVNSNLCSTQMKPKELVITNKNAKADSMVVNSVDRKNYEDLFPGSVVFKNSLGGMVVTFCGTPVSTFSIAQAFSFLTYSRKLQFINLLKQTGELPCYCPGDEEIYMRAADMADGRLFCAVFNIGLDPIDELEVVFEKEVTKIEKLMSDGSVAELSYRKEDGKYILDTVCNTLDPVILFAR